MLNRIERQYVEAIKGADTIRVEFGAHCLEFKTGSKSKLAHDIALAVQDYFVKCENNR